MPANASVDDRCTSGFDGFGQGDNFVPGTAALDQIEHREAEDDDEIGSGRLAHTTHGFKGKTDAVFETAAPFVGSFVGLLGDKLVDQVAFRAHDLDTIVAGLLRERGAAGVVGNGLADAPARQRAWREAVDWRAQL